MPEIGVTAVTIMKTRNDSLCHLRDLIIPFGISIVIAAERRVCGKQVTVSSLSQQGRRVLAGRQRPLDCSLIWLQLGKCSSSQKS